MIYKKTPVCPPDYCGIADRKGRITQFYSHGISAISKVLSEIGYFSDITIPKRYILMYPEMIKHICLKRQF